MIITSSARFLLITHLSGSPLQPTTHLRERLNSILDHELKADCQLLFCNVEQTELGWLIQSSQTYRVLDACLCWLSQPDNLMLGATGLCLERFELFEQYEKRGLDAAWQGCRNLVEKMYLLLLARS
ncbi:hypothetical protein [Pseudomonas chlororaphis]|uniref:STAS domain-containing protein n=1 Tax=Pseudomonas chlororaphis TaxID=587753 RepID=A0AAX3FM21_9PSED|nr:hypothetical protein [Pseudomonas chlororaphis]AZC37273.1 hypothetical protein C4K37_2886 [Pseudomonas chlororaphis subsp. piscium]AZC43820.1 hypothetical protein C4K36_2895 [Pseudomonas chlororaphis subsp. piscium]WDG75680.1 hypothetical protein PUP65_15285 [Pseudomonas chlororaphis]WDH26685.1 hypothetical protein PUP81_19035 [Pseudomonas chlororaphis]WDH74198.1 hypothetical protein PUP78_15270 [Pseudomonas chlororaphis]